MTITILLHLMSQNLSFVATTSVRWQVTFCLSMRRGGNMAEEKVKLVKMRNDELISGERYQYTG